MKTFKCSAECFGDCIKFSEKANIKNVVIKRCKFGEPIMTFKSSKTIQQLVLIADSIIDCHVLRGTLQPIKFYNGSRVWEVKNGKAYIDNGVFSPYRPLVNIIRKFN